MSYSVDQYSIAEVTAAFRKIKLTEKAQTLVRALAAAPNRAMSRIELARTIGSNSVNSCNTTYGTFCRNLAFALDPNLSKGSGDWVMFMNWGPGRWTPRTPGDPDSWVFIMRDTLAKALDAAGFAPFVSLDDDGEQAIAELYGLVEIEDESALLDPLSEIEAAAESLDGLSETVKEATILARVGQGVFRDRIVEVWDEKCSVTGSGFLPALVASHIKPWIKCSNKHRLSAANGLLLVGTLDKLFDNGYITFTDDGAMLIHSTVPESEYKLLGISTKMRLRKVPSEILPFLKIHRDVVFAGKGE